MSNISDFTPSSVCRYVTNLRYEDMRVFRACKDLKVWFEPNMNRTIKIISQTDNRDAYRNNLETGFGRFDIGHVRDGDLVFSNDMMFMTSETSRSRVKYRFENGTITNDPSDCWLLTYKALQTQVFREFRNGRPSHTDDPLLRDNKECPVCLEDLKGMLFECPNQHQINYECFRNLGYKKCPVCRVPYDRQQLMRYDAHKDQKITIRHYAHFRGSVVDAELKFCGFLKSIFTNTNVINNLIIAGIHHYLDTPHLPLITDNKFSLDLLDNEAWRNFETYLNSTQYRETIFAIPHLDAPYDYNENMFLTDLNLEFGSEALPKLTEASRNHQDKKKLRFQMYFIHRFLKRDSNSTKELITHGFNSTLTKIQYKQFYDLIETEIV